MAFTPRLTAPSAGDKCYTRTAYGGYNSQIDGYPQQWTGSVLANCTGYVHGRWIEIAGRTADNFGLSNGNGNTYYGHSDGFARSSTPSVGAIICYGGQYGHVAIVEQVNSDGSIVVSQSNYGGVPFEVKTLTPPTYYQPGGLTFQGFIVNPYVVIEPSNVTIYVYNGKPTQSSVKPGTTFTITADERRGEVFDHWEVYEGDATVSDLRWFKTTVKAGNNNSKIRAVFRSGGNTGKFMLYYIQPMILKKR